ncbi:hypothetical protein G7085_00505 [Tessaracoccus sp. HDW20]|nr:hypothetical protein [Tessaracoccus coleopterorum]
MTETAELGIGGQETLDYLVQHEATFAGHELHRHITVLLRTERHLVICHVDEGRATGRRRCRRSSASRCAPSDRWW